MITLTEYESFGAFWLQDIPDICIEQDVDAAAVNISINGMAIFSEQLYSDEEGKVVLRDIAKMLSPFIRSELISNVVINGAAAMVCYSRRHVAMQAYNNGKEWMAAAFKMPLSVTKEKFCRLGDKVPCYMLVNRQERHVTLKADSLDADGYLCSDLSTMTIPASEAGLTYHRMDIDSQALFAERVRMGFTPIGIYVYIDEQPVYVINIVRAETMITLEFANNFGLTERLTIPGTTEESTKCDSVIGTIYGRKVVVDAEEQVTYNFEGAPASRRMFSQITDAISSDACRIEMDGELHDIVFDSPNVTFSDNRYEYNLPKFSFTRAYKPSSIITL